MIKQDALLLFWKTVKEADDIELMQLALTVHNQIIARSIERTEFPIGWLSTVDPNEGFASVGVAVGGKSLEECLGLLWEHFKGPKQIANTLEMLKTSAMAVVTIPKASE